MVDVFLKEFQNTAAIPAGEVWQIGKDGVKLSESLPARFVPVLGVNVLNDSDNDISVILNESNDNAFKVNANGSRPMDGIPIWDIGVKNLGATEIAIEDISVVLYNDLEQVARYNAYAKAKGRDF